MISNPTSSSKPKYTKSTEAKMSQFDNISSHDDVSENSFFSSSSVSENENNYARSSSAAKPVNHKENHRSSLMKYIIGGCIVSICLVGSVLV